MNIVASMIKYRIPLPLKSKYTKEYAANRLVTVLKMVTVAAIKKVFMVILKKGSLLNTWM